MKKALFLGIVLAAFAASEALAQLRVPRIVQQVIPATRGGKQAQPVLVGIDALRTDFIARTGGNTIYFPGDGAVIVPGAKPNLALQAQWLRQHPEVVVRIEGHASALDTRDHALALGARRSQEVRDYLILLGVPAAQLTAVSMGKERPLGANSRAETILVR
jgi:peptidoglycan-associated lipoprotein